MKVYDICTKYASKDVKKVICESDGKVKYCNSLALDGSCILCNYICKLAVAIIVEKDGYLQYLAIEH